MLYRIVRTAPTAAATALTLALTATAAFGWEMVPELRLQLEADDNVVLRTDGLGRSSRTVLEAGATFNNEGPRGHLFLEPRVVADTYFESEHSELGTEDYYLRAGGSRERQRGAASFRADFTRESVIRAELEDILPEDPDIDEPIDDIGSGLIDFVGEDRNLYLVGGNLDFDLSERNRLRVDLQHRDVSYTGGSGASFSRRSAFDDSRLMLEIRRRVDERSQVSARMFASRFNAQRTDNITDTVGVEAVLQRPLSEIWSLNLTTGMQRSDYAFTDPDVGRTDHVDTNLTFGAGLRMRQQRSSMNIILGRRVNPSTSGFLAVRNDVRVFFERQLSPRLTAEIGARYIESRSLDSVSTIEDRDFARFEGNIEWAINPRLFLISGYQFTTQEYVGDAGDRTDSNRIFLGMTYRGLARGQRL